MKKYEKYLTERPIEKTTPGEGEVRFTIDAILYSKSNTRELEKTLTNALKKFGTVSRINVLRQLK
jgi:hypothetical protein